MKRTALSVFVLCCLVAVAVSCSRKESRISDTALMEAFRNPDNEWRGKPFWSWNGELDKDELIRQVGVLEDMGFGGYFMHSRVGLQTEYLGEEWFSLVNAVADEGERRGMVNYLYDEDRWPSGTAGGYVTMHPEYRLNYMTLRTFPKSKFQWADSLAAVFCCNLDGTRYTDLQRVHSREELASCKGKDVLAFFRQSSSLSNFYNGYTYVDAMNREATDLYIQLTHEAYKKQGGGRIGTSITGIFTDEPNRGHLFSTFGDEHLDEPWMAPWTNQLAQEYQNRFGGDILDKLPEIFLHKDGEIYNRAKWEYAELTQELFLENFVRPLYDWCDANGMALTGHFLHEDNLTSQVVNQGSLMRAYEYMHIPGIDILTQGNRNYWVAKQLSSVAHQTGKTRMLSELYGATGWQMSFQDYKEVGDWQALFGINLRCPHLSWYTMEGEAKRDYPASINFQSGWYRDFKYVEDYYARLGMILAQGKPRCDLLVINPVESAFAAIAVDAFEGLSPKEVELVEREKRYADLFGWLQDEHLDFDYGDEEMMSRLASVETGPDGPVLRVGEATYKAVLLGNMATIRSTTLSLLKAFSEAGGTVFLAGEAPAYVDAVPSDEAAVWLSGNSLQTPYTRENIVYALLKKIRPLATVADPVSNKKQSGIFCQVREDGDRTFYVFMNMSPEEDCGLLKLVLPETGHVSLWNCRTGKVTAVHASSSNDHLILQQSFPQLMEYVLCVTPYPLGDKEETMPHTEVAFPDEMTYCLNEPNVLPLDKASGEIGTLRMGTPADILLVDRAIRHHLGLAFRGGEMLQPWFFAKYRNEDKPMFGELILRFPFEIAQLPGEDVFLCMERPEHFTVRLNGELLDTSADEGWWVDPCLKKIRVSPSCLRPGTNEVELTATFTEDLNIEALYLTGNFGVDMTSGRPVLARLPETLRIGNIVEQGLPFYSGTVSYHVGEMPAGELEVSGFGGACVGLSDGGMIAFAPYRTVFSGGDLSINVVLGRRNTFGPLHQTTLHPAYCAPDSFFTVGDAYTESYVLLPQGLLEKPGFFGFLQEVS